MQRFSATISRDPNGYRWGEPYGFPTSKDDPENSVCLLRETRPKDIHKYTAQDFVYDPFVDDPALFRNFAKLEASKDAILQFANRYGDLGGRYGSVGDVVTLGFWRHEIERMKALVGRRDALVKEARGAKPSDEWVAKTSAFMNEVLDRVSVKLRASTTQSGVEVRTVCINLLEAMLVQLAASLDRRTKYRECDFCGKSFEVTPSINRSDRLFCSDNCRVKAYLRRKREAIRLRKQGKSLREIVKATKSDLKSVQKWVTDSVTKEKQNVAKTTRKR